MTFYDLARRIAPTWVRRTIREARARHKLRKNSERSAKEVFSEIYENGTWGASKVRATIPYSGPGSDEKFGAPYAALVRRFAEENNVSHVVDLGCGDFRVGSLLAVPPLRYTGIDVTDIVVVRNNENYARDGIEFLCRDIAYDDLPDADLCLAREVFQHLSNKQVLAVLNQMRKYRACIVTEMHPGPLGSFKPNIDRPHGSEARAVFGSGLLLDKPPFGRTGVELIYEIAAPDSFYKDWVLRTYLIRNDASQPPRFQP